MPIWFGTPTINDARESQRGLLAPHLGIEFTEWGDDFLRGTMPVDPRTRHSAFRVPGSRVPIEHGRGCRGRMAPAE
jgi:hypothetical protein